MTPKQFRQRLLADPFDSRSDILEAIQSDPVLQKFRDDLMQFEAELAFVLNDVPDPEYSSLMAAANYPDSFSHSDLFDWLRTKFISLQHVAITAIFLLPVVAIGFIAVENRRLANLESLFAESLVQHIYDDTAFLTPASQETFSNVALAFTKAGGQWLQAGTSRQPHIGYAVPCKIFPNVDSVHLLVRDDAGYVNVIVVRNSPVMRQFDVGDERFAGTSFSVGNSAIIVLGERGAMRSPEQLRSVKDLIAGSMEWNNPQTSALSI